MDIRASLETIRDRIIAARDDLVVALETAGAPAADLDRVASLVVTIDPTKLTLPGILVQFAGVDLDTLAGHTVQARALVIGPTRDDPRTLDNLNAGLLVVAAADLEVSGDITTAGVRVPQQPKPMPGLAVPVQIHESE